VTIIDPDALARSRAGQPAPADGDARAHAEARALALIGGLKNVQLLTYPASGFARVRLMGYVNAGWQVDIMTTSGSVKWRELQAAPRASLVWTVSHLPAEPMRIMIQLDGAARVLEGDEKTDSLERRIEKSGPRMREVLDRVGWDRQIVVRIEPGAVRVQGIHGGEEWHRLA
jgi:hypothetical protein